MSSQAVGGLIGGVVVGSVAARLSASRLLGVSAVLFGLIDLTIFLYPAFVEGIALGLILFVLVGVPATGIVAGLQTLLQRSAEDRPCTKTWLVCLLLVQPPILHPKSARYSPPR